MASDALERTRTGLIIDTETVFNVNTAKPTDWRPAEEEIDTILSFFDRFAALRLATAQERAGYGQTSPGLRAQVGEADWQSEAERFIEENGPLSRSQVLRVSWYPEDDPYADGSIPIALDFAGRTAKGSFVCGFVILTGAGGTAAVQGDLLVHRIEQTAIEPSLLADGLPPTDLLSQLPCYLGPALPTAFGN